VFYLTMPLRGLSRPDKYFLVKYLCDDKQQVRSRGYLKTDDDVSTIFKVNETKRLSANTMSSIFSAFNAYMFIVGTTIDPAY